MSKAQGKFDFSSAL